MEKTEGGEGGVEESMRRRVEESTRGRVEESIREGEGGPCKHRWGSKKTGGKVGVEESIYKGSKKAYVRVEESIGGGGQ